MRFDELILSAISSTRAPASPLSANSWAAMSSMLSRACSASLFRSRTRGFFARAKGHYSSQGVAPFSCDCGTQSSDLRFETSLGGEPDRGVAGAIRLVTTALDDLEKHALGESAAVEL